MLGSIGPGPAPCPGQEENLAGELPRIPPTAPAGALATFRIRPGFRLEPIAVEPLVTDPVSLAFDADGRIYVVEMRGYPFPEPVPSGRVRRLEDVDGDGRFDTGTTFVDGLSWPTSVVPYDGGVFIAAAPDILYAKDTDGDGRADVRRVMYTGFGTQNVQALVNGLLWGPDGWIYGVSGGNGGEIKSLSRPDAPPVSVRGRDFRFRPDGSAFEATSGGGQFGHAFDDWGHRFTCNNSNHIRQVVLPARSLERNPALVPPAVLADIAAEGPAAPVFRISPPEPWRVVRTRQRAADPEFRKRLAPTELVASGFFTSATGVTIYRGSAFPAEYRGNAFIGDVGGNLVHRKVLSRAGSIFRATRADQGVEFLASTDNWFRPVNFANTPDGTLAILDMYRETIEHPASIPEPIKAHLDLTSGCDRGRIYNVVPYSFRKHRAPRLSGASTAELVACLADPDAWWRETAQRLLIERKDPGAIPRLRDLAGMPPNSLALVHAFWTLDVLGGLRAEDLRPAVFDPEPGVREQVARLAAGLPPGVSARFGIPITLATVDDDAMVRLQAALNPGEVDDRWVSMALFGLAYRNADDPWIRTAALASVGNGAGTLFHGLLGEPEFVARPGARAWLEELAALVGAAHRPSEIDRILWATSLERDLGLARAIVLGLGRGLEQGGGSLRDVLARPGATASARILERAVRVARADGDPKTRAEAIRLVGLGPVEPALETLPPLLDVRQPGEVQLAALQALGAIPDRRVGPVVVARWKGLGPAARREAIEVLVARPDRLAALLDALETRSITAADLDPGRRKQLLAHADATVRRRAAAVLGPAAAGPGRGQVLAAYRPALDLAGDRVRGRLVFEKICATCHRAEGRGQEVGPDLETVAGRVPEDLLIQILDPNREVPPAYLNYTVATTDGRVLSGLIAAETATAVTVKRAEGISDVVPRIRIEEIASSGLSLMPEGLEQGLDHRALADLIAFLRSLPAGLAPPGR